LIKQFWRLCPARREQSVGEDDKHDYSKSVAKLVTCSSFLGQAELENSCPLAHPGGAAGRPSMNTIGGLLPIALCGLTSL
jgi:hypothetical protein